MDVGSFPGKPDEAVKNAKARVLVKFAKDAEGDNAQRKTRLSQVKVNVAVAGTWQIWDGLQLTDAYLNVLVERRKSNQGGMTGPRSYLAPSGQRGRIVSSFWPWWSIM